MVRILGLLALLCVAFPGQAAPCGLCQGKQTIGCPTCKAGGRLRVPCLSCRGGGKEPCDVCGDRLSEVRKALDGKGVKLGKGMLPCLNRHCDKKGRMRWTSGETDACTACLQKGQVKCPSCNGAAETKCTGCAGRGPTEVSCHDCAATGSLPCPLCRNVGDPDRCPLCEGAILRTCAICKGSDRGKEACNECGGRGGFLCETCHGLGKRACGGCGGSGKIRYVSGSSKAGVNRCQSCAGAGTDACNACTKGRTRCRGCDHGVRSGCPACPLDGRVVCGSCALGGWPAYEILAQALFDAGRFDRAAALFIVSRQKARGRFGEWRMPAELPGGVSKERIHEAIARCAEFRLPGILGPDPKARLENFQETTIQRLQKKLEEAKAKAAAGSTGHVP